MLAGFILAAFVEALVFVRWPVFGVAIPLVLLAALLVTQLQWLDPGQTILFALLGFYLVDALVALNPGAVLLSGLVSILFAMTLKHRLEIRGRWVIPVTLLSYQLSLWASSGGGLNFGFVLALTVGTLVSLMTYILLYFSVKRVEARL